MTETSETWPLDLLRSEMQQMEAKDDRASAGLEDTTSEAINQLHNILTSASTQKVLGLVAKAEILDEVDALLDVQARPRASFRLAVIRGAQEGTRQNQRHSPAQLVDEVLTSIDEVLADQATPAPTRPGVRELRVSVEKVRLGELPPSEIKPDHVVRLQRKFQVNPEQFLMAGARLRADRNATDALAIAGGEQNPDVSTEQAQWQALLDNVRAVADEGQPGD